MSSPNSPCGACKFLRRKCTLECVFAPYFPPDQPQKFAVVHKVFGASNVTKILNELQTTQRDDAVSSLAYEAETRLRDPVYGCVGLISMLQHRLKQLQADLENASKELSTYIGPLQPQAFMPQPPHHHLGAPSSSSSSSSSSVVLRHGQLVLREPPLQQQLHNEELFELRQMAAALVARDEQEMPRSYEQPQVLGFKSGLDAQGLVSTLSGFNQISAGGGMSPSILSLPTIHNNTYQIQPQQGEPPHHHHQLRAQLLELQTLPQQPAHQTQELVRATSQEGRSGGPSY